MHARRLGIFSSIVATATLLASCSADSAPPTSVEASGTEMSAQQSLSSTEPFTVRAPLDPFKVHALPDFLMHARARADIVMQRLVFQVGPGGWHTHPGVSFIYVVEGAIKLQRYDPKAGCTETRVFVAGEAYSEEADEIHRAVVVSAGPAVLLVTRFNIPVGAPLSTAMPNPGC
jgi:hypothetical protein